MNSQHYIICCLPEIGYKAGVSAFHSRYVQNLLRVMFLLLLSILQPFAANLFTQMHLKTSRVTCFLKVRRRHILQYNV